MLTGRSRAGARGPRLLRRWWDDLPEADQGILIASAFFLLLLAAAGTAAFVSML